MTPRSITEPTADGAIVLDEGNNAIYVRLPHWPNADGGSCRDAFVWFDVGHEVAIRQWIADGMPDRTEEIRPRIEAIRDAHPFTWEGIQNRRRSGLLRSADNELATAVNAAIDQISAML